MANQADTNGQIAAAPDDPSLELEQSVQERIDELRHWRVSQRVRFPFFHQPHQGDGQKQKHIPVTDPPPLKIENSRNSCAFEYLR